MSAFLGKGKKNDLIILAHELGLEASSDHRVIDLREKIVRSPHYDEELVKNMLTTIIEDRIAKEKAKEKEEERARISKEKEEDRDRISKEKEEERARIAKEKEEEQARIAKEKEEEQARVSKEKEEDRNKIDLERKFELEKLRLQLEAQKLSHEAVGSSITMIEQPKFDLKKLIPTFDQKEDDMSLFLHLFERQLKFLKVAKTNWVAYLLGALPSDVAKLIAREPEEKGQDYDHVKDMLLHRFKLSAEKLRQLFATHRKTSESTWKDFHFELQSYFEGWLTELKIDGFDKLKNLMIADQMKKRIPPDVKEHFLDVWCDWTVPTDIVEKLDAYDNLRINKREVLTDAKGKFQSKQKEFQRATSQRRDWYSPKYEKLKPNSKAESRPDIKCYGCGAPGIIKSRCHNCNPPKENLEDPVHEMNLYGLSKEGNPISIIEINICNTRAAVCADTGATHSVAGEKLYHLLRKHGLRFNNKNIAMQLADGEIKEIEVLTTVVDIKVQHKVISTEIMVLPHAKGNRTLLGTDFLMDAGIVLDIKKKKWHFSESSQSKYDFIKVPAETSALLTVTADSHPEKLREDEGTHLTAVQRNELDYLLDKYKSCFQPGGDPTPFIEHRINTGDHLPVAVPPYRMNPVKKEILRTEIEKLLEQGVIEECESPYAAPVVLIPKPDGSVRLCIDYRKLNANTVADCYPLPRMDDLLHEARPTSYMSTIDLRAGYHQVKMHPADQDKTAFVCPFGTYRYLRMPFGLRNAPATFQRLIDRFRSGLGDILTLTYLDDIIILSDTFEKHLTDLQEVFERLTLFNLHANRKKCHFACSRVKYLGFWITQDGIEVDHDKVSSIQKIPPPKNVKEVQSFLQTCSWFRRYVQNFADISRPLSELTKKKVPWKWGFNQQKAFETLKECLITPPVLKQADGTKPYVVRTDASNYALGAVLLQGQNSEEHPIEYASRLLTQAERNYSTTEREALAVVWALKKFRGYVEGTEITVASDHQPLKWLLSLKSPTGRLARWALELQSFNLKIQYIPGKANVIADMLSRPVCDEEFQPCAISNIVVADMPTRSSKDIRESQLKDEDLKKIIESFESTQKTEDYANWTERGFLMNQGVLYRYVPESDSEEAQLVIPTHERESILKTHHDAPMAGHYGEEGTFHRISKRYYWTGMRRYIADYVKHCPECTRYKASNQKPVGLLRTPVYSQRFEIISIDLFGPLPETETGKQWIFIVEDCATKWVEIFALNRATVNECAKTLIEEVFMRHGIPRRIISDNGPQFISSVIQQVCYTLKIEQNLIPVYFPQANPVERKNRDLKPRLAILVGDEHDNWHTKLPVIRFAMNTSRCETTGQTAAFLQFGRELRTVDDVVQDFRAVVENDNFVSEITPYLKKFATITTDIRDRVEMKQDQRKKYYDRKRRQMYYVPGDKVWVNLHPISKAKDKKTAKFMPKRDGPYLILTLKSPTSYVIASLEKPSEPIGTYHTSALKPFRDTETTPVAPLRKRGRPPKISSGAMNNPKALAAERVPDSPSNVVHMDPQQNLPGSSSRRLRSQRGRL